MAGPTIVIFGASGDLTARKLVPALFDNDRKQRLMAGTRIVGVARSPLTDAEFRARLHEAACRALGRSCDGEAWEAFAARVHYCAGDVGKAEDYARLAARLKELEGGDGDGGRLYYVALAPELYPRVTAELGAAGLVDEAGGWRRVVFEKPFGQDRASARALDGQLHEVLREEQIYRIDHYLGKETVQNVLALRFANTIFEPLWTRNHIDHVQITMAETVDVGSRGGYYDGAGVLRDMFQNHLLQVLAVVAMEPPARFAAEALRAEKVKLLGAVRGPTGDEVMAASVLGQYEGYHDAPGVAADSRTPTFGAVRLYVDTWRWQGVPFYLRSGKALAGKTTEVIVQFHCPPHMIFEMRPGETLQCNRLVLTIQPDEGVHISFQTKVPDAGMRLRESMLYFHYRDAYPLETIPDAYERLLLDALQGDAALFISAAEIDESWRIMDPIIAGWAVGKEPLPRYARGSWGPEAADALLRREGRHWVNGASLHHDE